MVTVAVLALAIVPSKQVTVPSASEHVPTVVLTERYITSVGKGSVTVTSVALAGPLLVTVSVYVSVSPEGTLGLGVAVFTIVTLALLALATTTVAMAVLLVRLGTILVAVALAVSAMFVPEAVPAFTCSTTVKLPVAFTARVPIVQVMTPAAPTAGLVQVQPPGTVMDWKLVLGGVVWVKLTVVAAAGPLFVTLWV
jgi:hypothetical protein